MSKKDLRNEEILEKEEQLNEEEEILWSEPFKGQEGQDSKA